MLNELFGKSSNGHSKSAVAELDDNSGCSQKILGQVEAISRVMAVIHFDTNGTILDANENFLQAMGYTLSEIRGQHHRIFVEPSYANSPEYSRFWEKLRGGQFERAEYKRIGKGGKEVWLLASYNPIFDLDGKVIEVVKFATDVTADKQRNADFQSQIDAIGRVQAVIEFELDGTVITANPVFLDLMGYPLEEVRGRRHSMFVEPGEEKSAEYRAFWEQLRAGKADSRVYKRFGKNGKQVWIQASYNPILDLNGKPFKVVKFASDLTGIINQTESTRFTAQSVATATEEMSSSISEISRSMDDARTATEKISSSSTESGAEAAHLMESMKSMEKIVGLIRDISGRVNMLALNATIEAARAGEAGKGFAVVAGEVKSLSDQTAKATRQIGDEIGTVQSISGKVSESIQQTILDLTVVTQSVSSVATAMEEQIAVTREISEHSSHMVQAVESILKQVREGNS